jgi:hypothetical protein
LVWALGSIFAGGLTEINGGSQSASAPMRKEVLVSFLSCSLWPTCKPDNIFLFHCSALSSQKEGVNVCNKLCRWWH